MEIKITTDIIAVDFHILTSFEWAILSLLSEFKDCVPTYAVASKELCIKEPAFLVAAVNELDRVGAIRLSDSVETIDLNSYSLTDAGREILEANGWESSGEQSLIHHFCLRWPEGSLLERLSPEQKEAKRNLPSKDELEKQLSLEIIERSLERANAIKRVKSFYVTAVE